MTPMDEQILKAAKEITVKFIETGRISPAGFHEIFHSIYQSVAGAVKENAQPEIQNLKSKI